jgi:hypothetical protein
MRCTPNSALVDVLTLPTLYRCPLHRLPDSRLLPPRSGLERSDFVRWLRLSVRCNATTRPLSDANRTRQRLPPNVENDPYLPLPFGCREREGLEPDRPVTLVQLDACPHARASRTPCATSYKRRKTRSLPALRLPATACFCPRTWGRFRRSRCLCRILATPSSR